MLYHQELKGDLTPHLLTGVLIIHEQEGRVWKIYRFLLKAVFGKDSCCEEKFKTIIICDGGQNLSFNISYNAQ